MLSRHIATTFAFLSLVTAAAAQSNDASCANANGAWPNNLGFVLREKTQERVSANDYAPTSFEGGAVSDLRVCIPLDVGRAAVRGAINIKVQIYDSSAPAANSTPNHDVEYENDTERFQHALVAYRRTRSQSAYPRLHIQDYQNYHACTPHHPHLIAREFHISVDNLRTDDDPFRQKFVFRRDVRPTCNTPEVLVEFFESLPSFGVAVSVAAGRYDPRVEKIVLRRSVILRYNLKGKSANNLVYTTYNLPRVGKDRCIRVEASDIFDRNSFGSQLIGVACVGSPE